MTPTTTIEEIRAHQRQVIAALTPTRHASQPFVRYDQGQDFREWAEAHPTSCFRRFDSIDRFEYLLPEISQDVELWQGRIEVVVAYPKSWAQYGDDYPGDLPALLIEDYRLLDGAIGVHGAANYVPGQLGMIEPEVNLEEGSAVVFLVLRYRCAFYVDRSPS